jgi:hypothetical protein
MQLLGVNSPGLLILSLWSREVDAELVLLGMVALIESGRIVTNDARLSIRLKFQRSSWFIEVPGYFISASGWLRNGARCESPSLK